MRLLGLAAILLASHAQPSLADCKPRVLGETDSAFIDAALARMRSAGVTDIGRISNVGEFQHYMVMGADLSVFLSVDDHLLTEIGFMLSIPASKPEVQKFITFASWTLHHLDEAKSETAIDSETFTNLQTHADGVWTQRSGDAVAVFTKQPDVLVVKLGKRDCAP